MADHDNYMEFEHELEVNYVSEHVLVVARDDREDSNPHTGNPIQPFLGVVEPRPANPAVLAMTDAQMIKCMEPITKLGKCNQANSCIIMVTAPTFHLAAIAVIDILQYGISSKLDELFEGPPPRPSLNI